MNTKRKALNLCDKLKVVGAQTKHKLKQQRKPQAYRKMQIKLKNDGNSDRQRKRKYNFDQTVLKWCHGKKTPRSIN